MRIIANIPYDQYPSENMERDLENKREMVTPTAIRAHICS